MYLEVIINEEIHIDKMIMLIDRVSSIELQGNKKILSTIGYSIVKVIVVTMIAVLVTCHILLDLVSIVEKIKKIMVLNISKCYLLLCRSL